MSILEEIKTMSKTEMACAIDKMTADCCYCPADSWCQRNNLDVPCIDRLLLWLDSDG